MRRAPLAVGLAILAVSAAAPLATGADTGGDSEPVDLSADHLEVDLEAKTALLTGHVKLTRGPLALGCPRVEARYDHAAHVTWARGSGGVVAEIKGVHAEAPEVEVDLAARSMELRGGVRLARGEGVLTAEKATINLATGKVTMNDVKGTIPVPKPAP